MKDQINSLNADGASRIAFDIINTIQTLPKGYRVMGLSMAFFLLCERYGQNPIEILEKTRRVTKDALSEGRGEHVRAVQNYLKGELN